MTRVTDDDMSPGYISTRACACAINRYRCHYVSQVSPAPFARAEHANGNAIPFCSLLGKLASLGEADRAIVMA